MASDSQDVRGKDWAGWRAGQWVKTALTGIPSSLWEGCVRPGRDSIKNLPAPSVSTRIAPKGSQF